jgi:hypothetical protein
MANVSNLTMNQIVGQVPSFCPRSIQDATASAAKTNDNCMLSRGGLGRSSSDLPGTMRSLLIRFHKADYAVDGDDGPTAFSPTKPANDRSTAGLRAPIPYRRYG